MPSWSVRIGGSVTGKYIGMCISGGKVYLPNTSTFGFGKYKAEPGDFIVYRDEMVDGSESGNNYARVLGKVSSHDHNEWEGKRIDFTGQLAVLWFHPHLGCASFRIIKAEYVRECYNPNDGQLGKFLQFMMSVPINAQNIKHLMAAEAYGSLSYQYVDNAVARIEDKHEDS